MGSSRGFADEVKRALPLLARALCALAVLLPALVTTAVGEASEAVTKGREALAAATVRDRQIHTFPTSSGKPLDIRVPRGHVEVRGEEREDISISVERDLEDPAAASSWPVILDEEEDHLAVHVLAPPASLAAVPVSVIVRAPPGTGVRWVEVGDGDLAVYGWRGLLTASVKRGTIVGEDVSGIVRFETSDGDIQLNGFELRHDGLLRCRTLSGNIDVRLSKPPADARVLLLTMGGRVTSDLPVDSRAGFGGRLYEGLIGDAKPLLSLDAVRGDLTVRLQ